MLRRRGNEVIPGKRTDSPYQLVLHTVSGEYDPAIKPRVMGTLLSGKISVQQARTSHEEQESGLSPVIFCYSL